MEESARPPVKVIRSARRRRTIEARFKDSVLEVRIPARMSKAEEERAVEDMLARAMKKRKAAPLSDAALSDRAARLNAEILEGHAQWTSIRWVGNMTTRWASCTTSTDAIRVSDRLQHVPDYVLDAVLVHELTHTFVPNHSREFWEWADRAPRAERAKGYLEAYQRFGPGGER
ncbi:M48 family metallopeptidase [Corynebacterium phoceense]|uniref:M48 metallopeptidase family protein n=1 Tax=Corynebacterium phoceense TaxID=1686286 RepID=UPI001DB5FA02|nr:M48 family metallopeptidase [Corynebacterium phoceense]MCQ9334522.1 M48 family metallopeptidase [Corynebacterium phoceense]HJG44057.1 M48 family metallopeptidase [Corynebacterium phoceense]